MAIVRTVAGVAATARIMLFSDERRCIDMENESETSCSSLLIRLFIKLGPAWRASAESSKVGITCRVSDRSRVEVHYSRTM